MKKLILIAAIVFMAASCKPYYVIKQETCFKKGKKSHVIPKSVK